MNPNILQLLAQFYGIGQGSPGARGQLTAPGTAAGSPALPGQVPAAQTLPTWIQSQLQSQQGQGFTGPTGTPAQQVQGLYPGYTPQQTQMVMNGQMVGALGSNNLPWTSNAVGSANNVPTLSYSQ